MAANFTEVNNNTSAIFNMRNEIPADSSVLFRGFRSADF